MLILLVALLNQALRNKSAHIRSMLWGVVLAKCLIPPMFSISVAVLPAKAIEQLVAQKGESSLLLMTDEVHAHSPTEVSSSLAPSLTRMDRLQSYAQQHLMILIWATVGALFYGVVLIRAMRIRSWLCDNRQPVPTQTQNDLEIVSKQLGWSESPQAWLITKASQPFIWGWCKGTVYLPQTFIELNHTEYRHAILAHELSHIQRRDPGVNLLQIIAQGLFWFHPLVWWANSQMRQEREKCCDEKALAHLGMTVQDYCQALVNTLARASQGQTPRGSLAISGPVKHMENRIKTMVHTKRCFTKGPSRLGVIVTMVLAMFVVPVAIGLTEKRSEASQAQGSFTAIEFYRDKLASAEKFNRLGRLMLIFTNNQEEPLAHFNQLKGHGPEELVSWARKNVVLNRELLGKHNPGMAPDPSQIVAYDQDLLKYGKGTNVLYLDSHMGFVDSEHLDELSSFMREDFVFIEACYYKIPAESNDIQAVTTESNGLLVPNGGLVLQFLTNEAIDRIHESLNSRLVGSPVVVAVDGKEASMAVITEEYFMLGKSETTTDLAHFEIEYMAKIRPNIVSETNEIMLRIEIEISELPDLEIPEGILPVVTRRTSSNRMTLEAGHGVFVSFPSVHGRTHHLIIEARRLTVLESLLRQSAYKEN
ncbi:MAG: M48 family metalloprotease [Planctomycetes bacterium]|nr:M48 family metalloprotease [Planctomycetota bacterium]